MIQKKDSELFIFVELENCPDYCHQCGAAGHNNLDCRLNMRDDNARKNDKSLKPKKRDVNGNKVDALEMHIESNGGKDVATNDIQGGAHDVYTQQHVNMLQFATM